MIYDSANVIPFRIVEVMAEVIAPNLLVKVRVRVGVRVRVRVRVRARAIGSEPLG